MESDYLVFDIVNLVLILVVLGLLIYAFYKISSIKSDVALSIKTLHTNMMKIVDEINNVNKVEFEVDTRQQDDIDLLKRNLS